MNAIPTHFPTSISHLSLAISCVRLPRERVGKSDREGDAKESLQQYPCQFQNGRLEKPASAIAISSYFGLEVVIQQLLIKNGIDDGYISDFDKISLLWTAERGHEAVVKLLLQTGKADLNLKDPEFGKTPIAYTAENGHKAIAELLLGTGQVDPDSISKEGWRPLAYASKNGHEAIVKLLLETGRVDPESVTEDRLRLISMDEHP